MVSGARLRALLAAVLLLVCVGGGHALKCVGEAPSATCGPASRCKNGVLVPGLCLSGNAGDQCCIPGSDVKCAQAGGKCTTKSKCPVDQLRAADLCPGTGQIVCCFPADTVPPADLLRTSRRARNKTTDKPSWDTLVKNRVSDLADFLVANMTLPDAPDDNKMCWPLTLNSTKKATVTEVSWGAPREGGTRCHAGVDLFTSVPGAVVSISHGVVAKIVPAFTSCTQGWGVPKRGIATATSAVFVYYPDLGATVNYGEMDPDKLRVREGDAVAKGTPIGIASYCGMLHFELYKGRADNYKTWRPPKGAGQLPEVGSKCATKYLSSKPANLLDPRPLLRSLQGRFCS